MRGTFGAMGAVVLLVTLLCAMPARAIVIEEVVKHHPLVVFMGEWRGAVQAPTPDAKTTLSPSDNSLPTGAAGWLMPTGATVSPDNMTVEVVPLRIPDLPGSVVFVLYLLGALVFYTLLVLVAQPSPAEYS